MDVNRCGMGGAKQMMGVAKFMGIDVLSKGQLGSCLWLVVCG